MYVNTKRQNDQILAINGGVPIRDEKLYYGHQWIDETDVEAVQRTLFNDFITCGPIVDQAEKALASYVGVRFAVVCSSGTAALHCACMAAGIKEGDEVITTPLTFAASANCILFCGGTPVFADIDKNTYNIDPQSIEEKITDRTKAVIAVDYTGQAVNIEEIRKICDGHGLIFIEDAAHSIGTKYDGRRVGSYADMTCFSFHPVKTVTSGEGGAIITDNKELYDKLVLAHAHGITHESDNINEFHKDEPWYYEQLLLGYNYRMTDFQAALLMSQLGRIDSFIDRRKEIVKRYDNVFRNVPGIIIQSEIMQSDTCRHLYVIRLDYDILTCDRKEFFHAISAENIQCQVHYIPIYYFPYYQKLGYKKGICPIAEEVYEGILSLPLYPAMTDEDVDDVIAAVKKVSAWYRKDGD